ncbi:class I SAM-dependent methyltransferase [Rufibacter tibetensis]|uniref:Methyltransferase type 11 n=1 Tax=Rufibacter tibetensis TaxID=512763 RepID=A0A0P0CI40_9BACT|nr:class I SAM-dependent methyltransferase [Rufibacter tibetensis]ALJ01695.1 methyltransferase type 11 [Rufibacter tibetensis]
MEDRYRNKSTIEEIRQRFDKDVERFSDLETGQQATIDAPLSLELVTEAAQRVNPDAKNLLDVGCGAGNYTLKMLTKVADLNCTLVDLSEPMVERAKARVGQITCGSISAYTGDIREITLPEGHYDIILAGAVLHHLRDDCDWESVFMKLFRSLRPGGSLWVSDLISHDSREINGLFWDRYGAYLTHLGGVGYKEKVLAYIEKEDSPRSLTFQLDLMRKVGFRQVEILHKNTCFAAYGGIK